MNHRDVQRILFVFTLLLIVLLCFYHDILIHAVEQFTDGFTSTDSTDGDSLAPRTISLELLVEKAEEKTHIKSNDSVANVTKFYLPQNVIDGVKTFVFFLGHPHSGHSIVAALMDAHPHMVISHEANLFTKLSLRHHSLAPTRADIFNTLWTNTKTSIVTGNRAEWYNKKGYDLFVNGLYQGMYVDYVDVIGEKKAGSTTDMLLNHRGKWSQVMQDLNSLVVTLKVIHVIRNPYDNIATMILYRTYPHRVSRITRMKSNITFKLYTNETEIQIIRYFSYYQAIVNAPKTYNLDMIEIHLEDLILDPRGTFSKLCNSLGVSCSSKYLDICSDKIYKTPSRTRDKIEWTDEQLKTIQENIEKYSSLKQYSFDSM